MSQSGTSNPSPSAATAAAMPESDLPTVGRSRSEILRATHVLSAEILSVRAGDWAPGAGGRLARRVEMKMKLLEVLKGKTTTPAGAEFDLEIEQFEESPRLPPANIWSALELEAHQRYLFVSNGVDEATAAGLLSTGALVRVSDGAAAADVHLARAAEALRQKAVDDAQPAGKDGEVAALLALVAFAAGRADTAGDTFLRYLIARVGPTFVRSAERPTADLVGLLTHAKAPFAARAEVLAFLDEVGSALGDDPAFLRAVAPAYFQVLVDPGAAQMHHRLVQVSLYLLIFPKDDGKARATAEALIPDAGARGKYRQALSVFEGDRAEKLARWLG